MFEKYYKVQSCDGTTSESVTFILHAHLPCQSLAHTLPTMQRYQQLAQRFLCVRLVVYNVACSIKSVLTQDTSLEAIYRFSHLHMEADIVM